MKKLKIIPCDKIGIFIDTDGKHYEDKVIAIAFYQSKNYDFVLKPITEINIHEGGLNLNEDFNFLKFKEND
jgi:hypothetical protein